MLCPHISKSNTKVLYIYVACYSFNESDSLGTTINRPTFPVRLVTTVRRAGPSGAPASYDPPIDFRPAKGP